MTEPRFGRETRVKVFGGEVVYKQAGQSITEIVGRVGKLKGRARDLRPAFDAFRPIWLEQTERVFASEGVPRWPALSPGYAAQKARRFPGRPILTRTGALRASLTGGRGGIWQTTPRTIRYGSAIPYLGYHQSGTSRMPARPALVLLEPERQKLNRLVTRYISTGETR